MLYKRSPTSEILKILHKNVKNLYVLKYWSNRTLKYYKAKNLNAETLFW